MIVGIGTDIVEVARVTKMLEENGETFIERIFSKEEQLEQSKRRDKQLYYAGRWAVKEAVAKALGCGFGASCAVRDICTLNESNGAPQVELRGAAKKFARQLRVSAIHVSISHEKHYACASAVLEKLD